MAKLEKRELLKNVVFLVEGETEKFYIGSLLKELNFKSKITISCMKGGGYRCFLDKIHKNKTIYDIIIVVADLDRAEHRPEELKTLKKLIELLKKENPLNNIFLTYKNIETWFVASLPSTMINSLNDYLGYKGSSKGRDDIFKRIKDKNGHIEIAKNKFKEDNLFFVKKDDKKGVLHEKNISKVQSNLIYFDDFLKFLDLLGASPN